MIYSPEEEQRFLLKDQADAFVSRRVGVAMREKLLKLLEHPDPRMPIVIDLDGIDVLTPSFVDECFGRLISSIGMDRFRSEFRVETPNKQWQTMINAVVRNRLSLDTREKST